MSGYARVRIIEVGIIKEALYTALVQLWFTTLFNIGMHN